MLKLLSQNIVVYGLTNVLKSLVPLFMLPILTAYLSIEDFGTLSLIETNILFLTPFILLNINSAINVEFHQLEKEKLKDYIANALLLSFISFIVLSLLFFFFRNTLNGWFNLTEQIVMCLTLFSALRVVSSVALGIMQMSQNVKLFAGLTLFQTILDFSLSYVFVVTFNNGYLGRLQGVYFAFLVVSLIGFCFLFKNNYIGSLNFNYTKKILKFGGPLILHAISGTIMAMSDRYFISYYYGNASVGLYAIAYQMSAVMLLVSMSVNQAWTPFLFKLLKKKMFKQAVKYSLGLGTVFILSGLCIFLLKDLLFNLFVNEEFWQAKKYFVFLLFGFIFQSLYFLVTNTLFFQRKTALLASLTIAGASLNLVLNYFFINKFSVVGVAYATCITWFIYFVSVLVLNIYILKKVVQKDP